LEIKLDNYIVNVFHMHLITMRQIIHSKVKLVDLKIKLD